MYSAEDVFRFLATSNGAEIVACSTGQVDCQAPSSSTNPTCAIYDDKFVNPEGVLWPIVLTGIMMCAMGFGIGANDAGNSWATSVASGALPLFWATLLCGLMDFLGAVTMGYGVSSKLSSGVSDLKDPNCWACGYCDSKTALFSPSMFGAQTAAAIFLLLATFTAMPVSTTHAITGGIVGGTVTSVGFSCLNWSFNGGLGGIVASWVISPAIAGCVGGLMYLLTYYAVIQNPWNPRIAALVATPLVYACTAWYMTYLIIKKSPVTKSIDVAMQKRYASFAMVAMFFFGVATIPLLRRNFPSITGDDMLPVSIHGLFEKRGNATGGDNDEEADAGPVKEIPTGPAFDAAAGESKSEPPVKKMMAMKSVEDYANANSSRQQKRPSLVMKEGSVATKLEGPSALSVVQLEMNKDCTGLQPEDVRDMSDPRKKDAIFVFKYLLVFTALLESFNHGANDTANATAAFSGVYNLYQNGYTDCSKPDAQPWVMALAGGFVATGVFVLGWIVIKTLGNGISAINFQRGFCVEFGSSAAVIIATVKGWPVSTTHCQVGAIMVVGLLAFGRKRVEWGLLAVVFATWVITIPFAALLAAMFTALGSIYFK